MEQTAKIYIAGHRGMVGSGLERKLRKEGFNNMDLIQKVLFECIEQIKKYNRFYYINDYVICTSDNKNVKIFDNYKNK